MNNLEDKSTDSFVLGNRYRTVAYLGAGETGIVYKGLDNQTQEDIAIKILKPELSKNEKFMEHLTGEIKYLSSLEHPNIVKVLHTDKSDGQSYIISEYIEGRSLDQLLQEKKKLTVNEVVALLKQIALALDFAHSKDIIHRALNPQNVLISNKDEIKITDFGLSKAASTAWITITGTFTNNLEYISPEQAEGISVDYRSDIYSLGVLGYKLLTGEVPFKKEGLSILALAMKQINENPVPVNEKEPSVPEWLNEIILKCLAKKAEQRFQSGEAVFRALENMSADNNGNNFSLSDESLPLGQNNSMESPDYGKVVDHHLSKIKEEKENRERFLKEAEQSASEKNPLAAEKNDTGIHQPETEKLPVNKNQKQLIILLGVVIFLELIIISIFMFILFNN